MERKRKMSNQQNDTISHIKKICDLEWNGSITILEFRKRINEIIEKYYSLKRWNEGNEI